MSYPRELLEQARKQLANKLKGPARDAMEHVLSGEKLLRELGRPNDAIMHFKKAKEISYKMRDQSIEAVISESLGHCYFDLAQYNEALKFAKEALTIFNKIGHEEGVGNGYVSLGNINSRLGRFVEAIDYQKKGLEISLRADNEKLTAVSYGNLGECYNLLEKPKEAIEFCNKAIKISIKIGYKYEEARSLLNMGNALLLLGKFEEAVQCCEKSLAIFTENDVRSSKGKSMCYAFLANSANALGNSKIALSYYEKCIKINKDLQQYTDVAIATGNMGNLYLRIAFNPLEVRKCEISKAQCLTNSIKNLKHAIELTNEQFLALSVDKNKTAFSDRFYHWHLSLMKSFCSIGRTEAALLVLDLGKAKALKILIEKRDQTTQMLEGSGNKYRDESWMCIEDGKEKERLIALSKEIQLKQSISTVLIYAFDRLDNLVVWVLSMDGSVSSHSWTPDRAFSSSLEALSKHICLLLSRVSVQIPRNYSFCNQVSSTNEQPGEQVKPQTLGLNAANSAINQSEIPVIGKPVPDGNTTSPNLQATASNHNDEQVSNIQTHLANVTIHQPDPSETRSGTSGSEESGLIATLSYLYEALIGPVEKLLNGTKLIIVPHGCLFFAPFSSLIDERGCYLSEIYQIQITPSLHSLASSVTIPETKSIGTSFFVGNPELGEISFKGKSIKPSPLPSATKEVENLASLLGAKALVGSAATKENVVDIMCNATIVHIAAHGDDGDILLAPNSIDLAKPDLPTEESYLLTQSDVLHCKLAARLVVLSCCYSGCGETSSEGVLGIARSFLGAGARSVLVTLWKIHDQATQEFMEHFYAKVCEGTSVCKALKDAMNIFQDHDQYKEFSYWAPFTIFGEDVKFTKEDIEEIRARNSQIIN